MSARIPILSATDMNALIAASHCHHITIRRYLSGEKCQASTVARIISAAKKIDLALPKIPSASEKSIADAVIEGAMKGLRE